MKSSPSLRQVLPLLLTAVVLGACSGDAVFRTKSIEGLMPALEFQLHDPHGHAVTAADYAGDVRMMFFGYTSCPDICPLTMGRLAAVVHALEPAERQRVRILFVSVDPRRDTPDKLREYVGYFGERIVGLSGEEPALRALAKRYRTTFGYGEPDATGFYEVSHSSGVYVFDERGEARLLFRPSDSVEAMASDLRTLLKASR